jgi:peptide/nickel transport system ATP-binding protein
MPSPLLEVKKATKIFKSGIAKKHWTVAVENLSLTVPGDTPLFITIAGESGSGKTTLANLVLAFLAPTSGEILYEGKNIQDMGKKELFRFRREVQVIFQDPYEVYNPFYVIDHVFKTVIRNFKLGGSKNEARGIMEEALRVVGLDPGEVLGKYPHEFSGGELQRITVARAFLSRPKLIVADEPVSMIDASLRVKLLDLLRKLKEEFEISFLYITHDLSTAYHIGDSILILYRGSVAESGDTELVMKSPKHPYVRLLIDSIPLPNPSKRWEEDWLYGQGLEEVESDAVLAGCKFRKRCPYATAICAEAPPPLYALNSSHNVSCYLYSQEALRSD